MGTGVNGMSFTYWSWNPNSGDTGGIVNDDWTTVNQAKQAILQPYLIPPVGGTGATVRDAVRLPSPRPPTPARRSCTATFKHRQRLAGRLPGRGDGEEHRPRHVNPYSTWTMPSGVTLGSGWNAAVTQSGTTLTASRPTGPVLARRRVGDDRLHRQRPGRPAHQRHLLLTSPTVTGSRSFPL